MNIKSTKLPKSQIKLDIVMPALELQGHVNFVLEKYAKDIEVKGFRKGKAPRAMVIDKIGLAVVSQESLDRAVQDAYLQTIASQKLNPITRPSINIKKFSINPNGTVSNDLEFEITLDLMPDIKMGDYTKIKITDKKLLSPEVKVTTEEVTKVLEHLQQQKSQMKDVDRATQKSDWVEISFTGKIKGVAQEKLISKNHPLIIGSNALVPGFEDQIIGLESGGKKAIKIVFPKDYHAKEFAGKSADFDVEIHKIKEIIKPKLDIQFAKDYGHQSLENLKEAIKKQLMDEKKLASKQKLESEILLKAKKLLKTDIPPGLLHQETDRIIDRMRNSIEKQGVEFNRYLDSVKKNMDDLHKELEPQAKANIEIGLILGEVIKREKLDQNDKEAPKKAMEKLVAYTTK